MSILTCPDIVTLKYKRYCAVLKFSSKSSCVSGKNVDFFQFIMCGTELQEKPIVCKKKKGSKFSWVITKICIHYWHWSCVRVVIFFLFHRNVFQDLYALSYMWYSATAVLFVVVVGLIVSFLTGRLKLLKATKFYAYMFRLNWQNYSYFSIPRSTSSVNVLHVSLQRLSILIAVKGIKVTGKEPDSYDVVSIPNKTCYFNKIPPAGIPLINFTKLIVLKLDVKIQRQIRYHVHLYQKKNKTIHIFFLSTKSIHTSKSISTHRLFYFAKRWPLLLQVISPIPVIMPLCLYHI